MTVGFIVRLLLFILTIIVTIGTQVKREQIDKRKEESKNKIVYVVCTISPFIMVIIYSIVLITTNWTVFAIPKILLLITVCAFIFDIIFCSFFSEELKHALIYITIFAYIIAPMIFVFEEIDKKNENIVDTDVRVETINTCPIICANDGSSVTGSISGGIFYVRGSISEESVYIYYYQLEDGGFKQGSVPAEPTTIYYIKDGEIPRVETVETRQYYMDYNDDPPTEGYHVERTEYKIYVPEGSIVNAYQFDAQ